MNMTRDRVQSFAWALIISVSFALLLALTFKVNAVKSQVRLLDRRIVALRQDKAMLETEFQTRSNQQQLAALNDVDFGFRAPNAAQYVAGEQQLAALSKPAAPDAPAPILMASADVPAGVKDAAAVKDTDLRDTGANAAGAKAVGMGGTLPAVFSRSADKVALGTVPAARMLAQRGEKVAPGGTDRFERKLALASGMAAAPSRSSAHTGLAAAASADKPERKLGAASGTDRLALAAIGARSHGKAAPSAAPASFLAEATGDERAGKTAPATRPSARSHTGLAAATTTAAAAAPKAARKPASVADAFGADWLRQISSADAKRAAPAKAKPGHRRVAIEDRPAADGQ